MSGKKNVEAVQAAGLKVVAELGMLARNVTVHAADNPVIVDAVARLIEAVAEVQRYDLEPTVRFVHDAVFVDSVRLRLPVVSMQAVQRLNAKLAELGLGGLGFVIPADAGRLRRELFGLLRFREAAQVPRPETFQALRLLPLSKELEELLPQKEEDLQERSLTAYGKVVYFVKVFSEALRSAKKPPKLAVGRRLMQDLIEVCELDAQRFLNLACIREVHGERPTHAANTAVLAVAMGRAVGFGPRELVDLGLAALLHEVGNAYLVEQAQDGTAHSRLAHEQLPTLTLRALVRTSEGSEPSFMRLAAANEYALPFERHRQLIAAGRPGLSLHARIVAIAHTYDELTRFASDTGGLLPDEALKALVSGRNRRFDPDLVDLLTNQLGLYPAGTTVELDTGETAVVFYGQSDPRFFDRPVVKVVRDRAGRSVRERIVDLSGLDPATGNFRATIRRSVRRDDLKVQSILFRL